MTRKIDLGKLAKKQGETFSADEKGRFTGYASVWGVPDDQNDVMHKGAFADSIEKYEQEGRKFPVRYMHGDSGPVGVIDVIREDDYGLYIEGDILHEASDRAREAYEMAKSGAVSELSVGFYYIEGAITYDENTGHWNVYKADLREVSLVDIGSNAETKILTIKTNTEETNNESHRVASILDGIIATQNQTALNRIDAAISKLENHNG